MRLAASVLTSVLLAALLAACGGRSSTEPPPGESGSATVVAEDSISIPSLGIRAPLSLKRYSLGAPLPSPNGSDDVAIYDFSAVPAFGGVPGAGGNVILAGRSLSEVRCTDGAAPPCPGVFHDLTSIKPGDRIELAWRGREHRYQVVSICSVPVAAFDNPLYARTPREQLTLMTGAGRSGPAGFSHVLLVIARQAPVTAMEPCPEGSREGLPP
jgi:hypothetical protein